MDILPTGYFARLPPSQWPGDYLTMTLVSMGSERLRENSQALTLGSLYLTVSVTYWRTCLGLMPRAQYFLCLLRFGRLASNLRSYLRSVVTV